MLIKFNNNFKLLRLFLFKLLQNNKKQFEQKPVFPVIC